MKNIDADKLKAEIERYENTALNTYNSHGEDADFWYGKVVAFEDLKTLVASLQKEQEADLEKEYKTWWNSISGKINVEHIMEWYMHETARHFYELGLNARKMIIEHKGGEKSSQIMISHWLADAHYYLGIAMATGNRRRKKYWLNRIEELNTRREK